MEAQVSQWGNSLAVRIPRDVALKAALRPGDRVEMTAESGRIILERAAPRYALADLLTGMTPASMREAFDWGEDMGRESIP